ncbi:MAG: hypothetical protein NTU53_13510 [Planctomycetota bacterium]|nr:hypothetical protein [Planctomycetota bacterium]
MSCAGKLALADDSVISVTPEDLLLILCAYGTKHCWDRLDLICGVSELIRARVLVQRGVYSPSSLECVFSHLRARQCPRHRAEYCLRLAMMPKIADFLLLALPASLSFLYYPLRPIRLVRRLLRGTGAAS